MNAFDIASRMDQMRMMEQSTRLNQQRQTQAAQVATVQAKVAVRSDGFEVVRSAPVALSQSAPVEVESSVKKDLGTFRRNELVDSAKLALSMLNQK
jgi:hypothetical protein